MSPVAEQRRVMWRRFLAEQQASGLSVTAWCYQQNIQEGTFYYWRKRLTESTPSPGPQWVTVSTSGVGTPLTLRVGRVAIEVSAGFDPHLLADVLAVVEARC